MRTLKNLEAGDFVDGGVDEIVENLRDENPDKRIDYENIYTDSQGYMAEIEVEGLPVAVVESLVGDPMVKKLYEHNISQIVEGDLPFGFGIERIIEVRASSESEALEKAHKKLQEDPIRSEELEVV